MHLIAIVVEMKDGNKVVTLNNRRVYVSTDQGLLEPASATWLWLQPPAESVVRGCVFDCGSVTETPPAKGLR